MEDYYLAASIQRQEQEEIENRRMMSEIEKACAETDAKVLEGDRDNAEMGDGQTKPQEKGETNDEGMGEGNSASAPPVASAPVQEESMSEEKTRYNPSIRCALL